MHVYLNFSLNKVLLKYNFDYYKQCDQKKIAKCLPKMILLEK